MKRFASSVVVLSIGILLATALRADEPSSLDQSRARLREMREQVERLEQQGKPDVARALAEQVETMERKLDSHVGDRQPSPKPLALDQARLQLREMHELAELLWSQGKMDEARAVAEKAKDLERRLAEAESGRRESDAREREAREQREQREQAEGFKRRIEELAQAGEREEADQVGRQLRELMERVHGAHRRVAESDVADGRHPRAHEAHLIEEAVHHLHEASTKLAAAGVNEPAKHLREMAEELQRHAQRVAEQVESQRTIEALRREVEQLRVALERSQKGRAE